MSVRKSTLHDDVELLTHVVVTRPHDRSARARRIFPSAVIGGDSQSVHHSAGDTTLVIGEKCTIREGVTMNTGTVERWRHDRGRRQQPVSRLFACRA